MDVGNPSNFVRILELFHHKLGDLRKGAHRLQYLR